MYLTLNNARLSVQILLYNLFISFVISHHIDKYFDAFVTHFGDISIRQKYGSFLYWLDQWAVGKFLRMQGSFTISILDLYSPWLIERCVYEHSHHTYNVDFETYVGFSFLVCVFLKLIMCYVVLWVWHKKRHESEIMSYFYRYAR